MFDIFKVNYKEDDRGYGDILDDYLKYNEYKYINCIDGITIKDIDKDLCNL
jgi:hypothetical protein